MHKGAKIRKKIYIAQKTLAQDDFTIKLNNPTYHFAGQLENPEWAHFFGPRFLLATAGMKFTKLYYPRSSFQAGFFTEKVAVVNITPGVF